MKALFVLLSTVLTFSAAAAPPPPDPFQQNEALLQRAIENGNLQQSTALMKSIYFNPTVADRPWATFAIQLWGTNLHQGAAPDESGLLQLLTDMKNAGVPMYAPVLQTYRSCSGRTISYASDWTDTVAAALLRWQNGDDNQIVLMVSAGGTLTGPYFKILADTSSPSNHSDQEIVAMYDYFIGLGIPVSGVQALVMASVNVGYRHPEAAATIVLHLLAAGADPSDPGDLGNDDAHQLIIYADNNSNAFLYPGAQDIFKSPKLKLESTDCQGWTVEEEARIRNWVPSESCWNAVDVGLGARNYPCTATCSGAHTITRPTAPPTGASGPIGFPGLTEYFGTVSLCQRNCAIDEVSALRALGAKDVVPGPVCQ